MEGMQVLPSRRPQVRHPHPWPGQPRGWGLAGAGATLPAAPAVCPTCAQRRRSRPPVPRAPRRPRPRRSALGGHCGRRARRRTLLPSPPAAPPPPRPPEDRRGPPRRRGRACWDTRGSAPRPEDQQAGTSGGQGGPGQPSETWASPRIPPGLGFLLCTGGQLIRPTLDGASKGQVIRTK